MVVNLFKQKAINFKAIKSIKKPIEVKPTIVLKDDEFFGPGKQNMREQVLRRLRETAQKFNINKGIVLTLSCVDCRMEALVNAVFFNYRFLSYECEKELFKQIKVKIKNFGFDFMLPPVNGYIIDAIKKADKDTYAHLFLDFCKTI